MSQNVVEFDADGEIAKIMQQLTTIPDQIAAPKILKNALNAATRKARRRIIRDAKGRYAIKDKAPFKDKEMGAPQVMTASSTKNLEAAIISRGGMLDIMAFMTRPNEETGAAAAQVLNSGGMKPLEGSKNLKAFVTRFSNGHVAIVQRRGDDRLPVKKITSPAVPHMLGNEEVRSEAQRMAFDILQTEIEKRIAKVKMG